MPNGGWAEVPGVAVEVVKTGLGDEPMLQFNDLIEEHAYDESVLPPQSQVRWVVLMGFA
jgi:hypothetical protein